MNHGSLWYFLSFYNTFLIFFFSFDNHFNNDDDKSTTISAITMTTSGSNITTTVLLVTCHPSSSSTMKAGDRDTSASRAFGMFLVALFFAVLNHYLQLEPRHDDEEDDSPSFTAFYNENRESRCICILVTISAITMTTSSNCVYLENNPRRLQKRSQGRTSPMMISYHLSRRRISVSPSNTIINTRTNGGLKTQHVLSPK